MSAVEWLERIGSTNAELVRRARIAPPPHLFALATLDQTAGRGRLDRSWSAPAGTALAVSVLLRPRAIPTYRLGLLPLIGGLAARAAVAAELPAADVSVKWPNDVLVAGRKIAGVLAELEPSSGAVILGIGMNTTMREAQLPVPTATSIAIESGENAVPREIAERVLTGLLASLGGLVDRLDAAGGDLERSGIRPELEEACGTLGQRVRVEQPGGSIITGTAIGIGPEGSLVLAPDGSGSTTAILAGDITHLRYQ